MNFNIFQVFVIAYIIHSGSTCSTMKDIRLDNITPKSVIVKANSRKTEENGLKLKIQREFTKRGLQSSINVISSQQILDVCGSKLESSRTYIFVLESVNGSTAEFKLSGPVYFATKSILRQVRRKASELEAAALAEVAKTTVNTAATTLATSATTIATTATTLTTGLTNVTTELVTTNATSAVEAVTEAVGHPPSMARVCVENLLTCFSGGTCYEIGGRPHCICPSGRRGTQCELYDTILTFESTSTDKIKNHDCNLLPERTTPSFKTNLKKRQNVTFQVKPNPFLDMTESLIALGVIFVVTALIIVLGVYLYVRNRRAVRHERMIAKEANGQGHKVNPKYQVIIPMQNTRASTSGVPTAGSAAV